MLIMLASIFSFMGIGTGYYFLFALILIAAFAVVALALQYKKVGPNEVLIVSGGRRQTVKEPDGTVKTVGYRTHIGGGTFVIPLVEKALVLPIDMITINIQTPEIYTNKGVPLIVEATAQVRISTDDHSLRLAAEQFLSKGHDGIRRIASEIIDGHTRSALGTMDVEEIYQDQMGFAEKVIGIVKPEFKDMGLNIVSFSLSSIKDTQGYLEALGRPRIAQVKKDADIAEAEAEKEAIMKAAGAKKESAIAKLKGEAEISEAHRDFETQKAIHDVDINNKRAKADMAYDLERHRLNQDVKKEEYKVKIVEKEQSILLEERESKRVDKELETNVKKPAEARKYEEKLKAEAEAYRIQKEAEARSQLIKDQGAAEAEAMLAKAKSWEHYTQAAMFEILMSKLPELAQSIASPLSKVDKITVVSSGGEGSSMGVSKVTGEVAKILAQMPEVIESLSGVDVKKLLGDIPKAKTKDDGEKAKKKDDGTSGSKNRSKRGK